ncbi:MAG: NfeD family protein [Candidatus Auribacterota bacterium]
MSVVIFLALGAILLIVAEFFVPGGVLGFIGSIMGIIAAVMCFHLFGVRTGLYFVFGLFLFVTLMVAILVSVGHKLPFKKSLYLSSTTQNANVSLDYLASLVGKDGTALTMLRPSGRISIDGKRYDAQSEGIYVDKGTTVKVLRIENNHLIIRPKSSEQEE